jgi:hypothetical protein
VKSTHQDRLTAALIFIGIAILVHAGLSYDRAQKNDPAGTWIYSTREGVPARTDRQTGEIEFAGPKGWHKWGEVKR